MQLRCLSVLSIGVCMERVTCPRVYVLLASLQFANDVARIGDRGSTEEKQSGPGSTPITGQCNRW